MPVVDANITYLMNKLLDPVDIRFVVLFKTCLIDKSFH